MVAIFNVVQGAPGGAPMLVLQDGAAPAPGAQIGVHVFWVPGVPPPAQEAAANRFMRIVQTIYAIGMTALSALKDVIDDMNATGDLLQLFVTVTEICEKKFSVPVAHRLANVFKGFMEINSPRSLFNRAYSILSGDALNQEPFENHLNWIRLLSKTIFAVSDLSRFLEWCDTIQPLPEKITQWIGNFHVFQFALTLTHISTIATIAGSILNAIDNSRLIYKYSELRDDTPEHERCFKLMNAKIDLANDICRIACAILCILPYPWAPFVKAVVGVFSNGFSLWKFSAGEHTKRERDEEHAQIEATKAGALQLVERELELAATGRGDARISIEAVRLIQHTMRELAKRPRVIHLMGSLPLALEALRQAEAMPTPDPLAILQLQWARHHLELPLPARG